MLLGSSFIKKFYHSSRREPAHYFQLEWTHVRCYAVKISTALAARLRHKNSGPVNVHTVGQRHEVREQLQGYDLRNGEQVLGGRFYIDAIAYQACHLVIAGIGNRDDPRALRLHIAQQLQRLLIAED